MLFPTFLVAVVISSVSATGILSIVSSPPSLSFKNNVQSPYLKQSLLCDVYSTALGFSINPNLGHNDHSGEDQLWQGMYINDPFNLAECIVNVIVTGVSKESLESNKIDTFPLSNDEHEQDTWNNLISRVQQRYPYGNSVLARIELGNGIDSIRDIEMFKKIKGVEIQKVKYLDAKVPEDNKFLGDIALLNSIADSIAEEKQMISDGKPDVIWIVQKSLHSVHDLHGQNSSAAQEANELLLQAVENLSSAFKKAFKGKALVTLTTSDEAHTRRFARAAENPPKEGAENPDLKDINLAKNYGADYPVIFNIILWFGVAMFFALLAISLVIGNMDPGRDSIIYRMTSNRMKKDN